jgi:hypothetical protein
LQTAHILVGRSDLRRIFGMGDLPGEKRDLSAQRLRAASALPEQIEPFTP